MNLPLPSADKIISKSKATKTVKGVWDKTTASLEMNMSKAQDAMASYQNGKLHDPDKFTCAFFKVISAEKDLIQLHFKVGGMMVGLNDDGDTTLRVKGADAAATLNAWDSYISSLKIDQDDFAKRIKPLSQKLSQSQKKKAWSLYVTLIKTWICGLWMSN